MRGIATLVLIAVITGPGIYGCGGGGSTLSPNGSNLASTNTTNSPNPTSSSSPVSSSPYPMSWMSIAVTPDTSGKFAYVTHSDSNTVKMYSINPATGGLRPIGTVAAGASPGSVAIDPFGKFAYVANGVSNDISMYTINSATGALQPMGTVPAGASPASVAVDPSGKFAYVANEGSNDISMYMIDSTTGALQPLGPVAAGTLPTSVAIDPSGKFAYVTNANPNSIFELNTNDGSVSIYAINATSGILASIATIDAGIYPRSLAVDPGGKFAYVANCGDFERNQGNVAMYIVNAVTGTLSSSGTMEAGSCPLSVAVHPSGKFAYATNTGSDGGPDIEGISMYAINPTTGALMSIGFINAGYCPSSLAIDPSGKFAYVTNHCDGTISMYTIDSLSGALALIGTIGT